MFFNTTRNIAKLTVCNEYMELENVEHFWNTEIPQGHKNWKSNLLRGLLEVNYLNALKHKNINQ